MNVIDYNHVEGSIKEWETNIKRYVMFMSRNRDNNYVIKKCCRDILWAFDQITDARKRLDHDIKSKIDTEIDNKIRIIEIDDDRILDTNIIN